MPVQHTFGTAGATGGGFSAMPGTLQPAFDESRHEPRWSWQQRAPKTWRDRNRWTSLWSFGCRLTGGNGSGQDGEPPIGRGICTGNGYEPFSCDGEGTQTLKFIKGVCVDASGNPLSGVSVMTHRTDTHEYGGYEVLSREDGSYDAPTNFGTVAHYLVAYLPGSPDRAGTTVDTLVPANIDGT